MIWIEIELREGANIDWKKNILKFPIHTGGGEIVFCLF